MRKPTLLLLLLISNFVIHSKSYAQSNSKKMKDYSVKIEIFRKGTYKIFSMQLENREFEAIKFYTNDKPCDTVCNITLAADKVSEIELIISNLSLEGLKDEYVNTGVKGEHHLMYFISIDGIEKEIYVYFEEQEELKQLFEKMMIIVPEEYRLWYYR